MQTGFGCHLRPRLPALLPPGLRDSAFGPPFSLPRACLVPKLKSLIHAIRLVTKAPGRPSAARPLLDDDFEECHGTSWEQGSELGWHGVGDFGLRRLYSAPAVYGIDTHTLLFATIIAFFAALGFSRSLCVLPLRIQCSASLDRSTAGRRRRRRRSEQTEGRGERERGEDGRSASRPITHNRAALLSPSREPSEGNNPLFPLPLHRSSLR